MARRLGEAGYRVTTADSGAAAIAELYRLPIDLVLAELEHAADERRRARARDPRRGAVERHPGHADHRQVEAEGRGARL